MLADEHIEYVAQANGNEFVQALPLDRCDKCGHLYMHMSFADELDEFIANIPADLKIVREVGIASPHLFEAFVAFDNTGTASVSSPDGSMTATIDEQSELFRQCLHHITRHDTGDHGHESSPTIKITPGPPYSDEQRRTIQVLVAQLTLELGEPPRFWSFDFDPWPPESAPEDGLLKIVEGWRLDSDRAALALVNRIAVGAAPGPFVNAFRLLETVLTRIAEDEIRRARFDTSVTQPTFMEKVRTLQLDLAARLRSRIRSLSRVPTPVLRELWTMLVSNRRYEADEVFQQIAKVRNRNVHAVGSDPDEALRLPWEEVPFHLITDQLVLLISEIVSVYEEDVAGAAAQPAK